jgi:hypothetical protein
LTLSSAAGGWKTLVGAGTSCTFNSCARADAGKQRTAVSPVKNTTLPLKRGHLMSFDPQT